MNTLHRCFVHKLQLFFHLQIFFECVLNAMNSRIIIATHEAQYKEQYMNHFYFRNVVSNKISDGSPCRIGCFYNSTTR